MTGSRMVAPAQLVALVGIVSVDLVSFVRNIGPEIGIASDVKLITFLGETRASNVTPDVQVVVVGELGIGEAAQGPGRGPGHPAEEGPPFTEITVSVRASRTGILIKRVTGSASVDLITLPDVTVVSSAAALNLEILRASLPNGMVTGFVGAARKITLLGAPSASVVVNANEELAISFTTSLWFNCSHFLRLLTVIYHTRVI